MVPPAADTFPETLGQLGQEHPWERAYARQGKARPPVMKVTGQGRVLDPLAPPTPAPVTPKIDWNDYAKVELEVLTTAEVLRAEQATKARRWQELLRMGRLLAGGVAMVVGLLLTLEVVQLMFNRLPSAARLEREGQAVAGRVLQALGTPGQPLEVASVQAELFSSRGGRAAAYDWVITLRLQAPLYARADSNGAGPYLQLQRSLDESRESMLQHRLFLQQPGLANAPVMPLLLAVTHRAGERLVVKVPMEASRLGWRWSLRSAPERLRVAGDRFTGEVLARYGETPHLVFGTPAAREKMRPAMVQAREFVLAVNAELARRGIAVRREAAAAGN